MALFIKILIRAPVDYANTHYLSTSSRPYSVNLIHNNFYYSWGTYPPELCHKMTCSCILLTLLLIYSGITAFAHMLSIASHILHLLIKTWSVLFLGLRFVFWNRFYFSCHLYIRNRCKIFKRTDCRSIYSFTCA